MGTRLPDLVVWFSSQLEGWRCYAVIPAKRPDKFITIERIGGGENRILDEGQYAIQVWAESMLEAARSAEKLRALCVGLASLPWVAEVQKGSLYNFPDPDSKQARYQFTLNIKTLITE